MAEMTASEAIQWLNEVYTEEVLTIENNATFLDVTSLIQRQAAEIERLQPKVCEKMCLNVTDKVTGVCSHEPYCRRTQGLLDKCGKQAAQIAKKDREISELRRGEGRGEGINGR